MVVALRRAGDGWHGNDHRRFRHTALNSSRTAGSLCRRDDNPRSKVQNVCKDSSHGIFADHSLISFSQLATAN
jgi:hypothetical protein